MLPNTKARPSVHVACGERGVAVTCPAIAFAHRSAERDLLLDASVGDVSTASIASAAPQGILQGQLADFVLDGLDLRVDGAGLFVARGQGKEKQSESHPTSLVFFEQFRTANHCQRYGQHQAVAS